MKIEDGKSYIDENGNVVGPMMADNSWFIERSNRGINKHGRLWAEDGVSLSLFSHCPNLIAEWVDEAAAPPSSTPPHGPRHTVETAK